MTLGAPTFAKLKRFAQARPKRPQAERCELCGQPVVHEHPHVVNIETRQLLCACRPCYLLFMSEGAGAGKLRAVPERTVRLERLSLSEDQWDRMQIPVAVVFVFRSSQREDAVAFYPGPAGATESLLSIGVWEEIAAANPVLQTMLPDVEATLIYRSKEGQQAYLVPITKCYELTGLIRLHWRGFHGGAEAWQQIDAFFAGLAKEQAR